MEPSNSATPSTASPSAKTLVKHHQHARRERQIMMHRRPVDGHDVAMTQVRDRHRLALEPIEHERASVLSPFTQRSGDRPGARLGPSISRRAARAIRGTLCWTPGCAFTVNLPLS